MILAMRAAILAVGSELLSTDRTDTNSLRLAESLERHGVSLVGKQVVGDDARRIESTVRSLTGEVELLLVTGGLGPTSDDVTRTAVAAALDRAVLQDPDIVEDIRRKFAAFGREMPPSNARQAEVPEGAQVIDNPRGTAPGLILEHGGTTLFLFPGVPRELEGMILAALDPWLEEHGSVAEARKTLRVACLPESEVEDRLAPVYEAFGEIGLLAAPGDIKVRLRASDEAGLNAVEERVRGCLGPAVYGTGDDELERVVGRELSRRGETLVTAESCTGGWVAQRITAIPGSSAYFLGAIVAYDNRVKVGQLGVSPQTLEAYGAVSREVVEEMAVGARQRLGGDWALAVSGVAGPEGGTPDKPVGRVDLALAGPDELLTSRSLNLPGDRQTVRLLATQWALDLLRGALREEGE